VSTSPADLAVLSPAEPRPGPATKLTLDECRRPDSLFAIVAQDNAVRNGVEPRALIVRTLLHLPRVAGYNGRVTLRQVETELFHSSRELRADHRQVRRLIPTNKVPLQDLQFVELETAKADAIFSHLHYLRSARPGSLNFALVDPVKGLPVSLCSVSPLEWRLVGRQISTQFQVPMSTIWDVSRVYSFDIAPANAISFLLAKVRARLRRGSENVQLLTTAVDPNLGFSGSSYRAANWQPWMTIQARPYLYFERRYASPRQLRRRFGTANLAELQSKQAGTFEQSSARLLDSTIFCCRIKGETETLAPGDVPRLRR